MGEDLKFILGNLGLTKTESIVFAELLNENNLKIGVLIKKTGLHRGTVYNTLQRLIGKGLISTSAGDKSICYSPNPNAFLSQIEEKKRELEEQEKLAKYVFNHAEMIKKLCGKEKNEIELLYGTSAFKGFFVDLLNKCRQEEEKYIFLGDGGEMRDVLGGGYYKFSQKLKQQMGVKCKVVLNESKKKHPFVKEVKGKVRWMPEEISFPTNTWVYDNKVVIVDWFKKPLPVMILNNKNIARTYLSCFKVFWGNKALTKQEHFNC